MGPLAGVRVIEMAGIGPAPFCGMLLADMGAEVVRVDRLTPSGLGVDMPGRFDLLNRGKRTVALDLKAPDGASTVLKLVENADILIEGFRPGVMERLGLGPEPCLEANPRLVFGRMTGWGQEGPLAQAAGHDLNYIALTGALAAIGPAGGAPAIPLNLLGDFGGGALYLAMGVLAALVEARNSGRGQVVDAAIVDGTASLMTMFHAFRQMGAWAADRGTNLLDGGAPFYSVYATSDGRYVTVAALERKFYDELVARLGLSAAALPDRDDRSRWPELRAKFAAAIAARTCDELCVALEGSDACFAPVLDIDEARRHEHMAARNIHIEIDGVAQPAPAPRFSRTPSTVGDSAAASEGGTARILADWGVAAEEIERLRKTGVAA